MDHYKHTQVGYVTFAVTLVSMLVVLSIILVQGLHPISTVACLILVVVAILFASLTIEIQGRTLRWYFGPGIIHKRVQLTEIERVEEVQNRWWYGWGIRYTPHGWLYNVAGSQAVQVQLKSGKKFRLGTDEPEALRQAIEQALL